MSDGAKDLLLIGSNNPTTWIVYNRLVREFGLFDCIIEEPVDKSILLRNRIRKLGYAAVLGQMAFVAFIRPILRYQAMKRIREICQAHDLEVKEPMTPAIARVENINDLGAVDLLRGKAPRIVIVNGTRILKPVLLNALRATFINTHQGITPRYRGAHGAYWALYSDDLAHCGVTVHLVDHGIDTGNIVGQATIAPEPADSFVTYPFLQTAAALPILSDAIRAIRSDGLKTMVATGASAVWYHPRLFQYFWGRLRGVR